MESMNNNNKLIVNSKEELDLLSLFLTESVQGSTTRSIDLKLFSIRSAKTTINFESLKNMIFEKVKPVELLLLIKTNNELVILVFFQSILGSNSLLDKSLMLFADKQLLLTDVKVYEMKKKKSLTNLLKKSLMSPYLIDYEIIVNNNLTEIYSSFFFLDKITRFNDSYFCKSYWLNNTLVENDKPFETLLNFYLSYFAINEMIVNNNKIYKKVKNFVSS